MDDFSDKSAKSYSYLRATGIEQAAVYDGRTNERATMALIKRAKKVRSVACTVHSLHIVRTYISNDLTNGRTALFEAILHLARLWKKKWHCSAQGP